MENKSIPNVIYTQRDLQKDIYSYIEDVLEEIKFIDYYIEEELCEDELRSALNNDFPDGANKESMILDIINLCSSFYKTTESKFIRIQIEKVKTDMCRLFHVDNIKQRLLCTYLGRGTQWLNDSNVKRNGLGMGDNDLVVKDYSQVNETRIFDIILLRGKKHEGVEHGVVHRSPPIEDDNSVRLLLKIDELE